MPAGCIYEERGRGEGTGSGYGDNNICCLWVRGFCGAKGLRDLLAGAGPDTIAQKHGAAPLRLGRAAGDYA